MLQGLRVQGVSGTGHVDQCKRNWTQRLSCEISDQTPPGPPRGGPPGGLGRSGVGAWVGPRARALTSLPSTTHVAAPEESRPTGC